MFLNLSLSYKDFYDRPFCKKLTIFIVKYSKFYASYHARATKFHSHIPTFFTISTAIMILALKFFKLIVYLAIFLSS